MRLRLNDQAVLCVEIMLDIASWVTQQIFAISMPAICHNRRTTTFYNFSTTFEAKRMAQEDTRRMKKISRIEYCAGFEPLQSGMEQDEGSRILLPPMKAFLDHLQTKGFRNRRIGLMENGSWAPAAARLMRAELEKMKELRLCETDVSLRGALNQTSEAQMDALVAELCAE